MAEILSSRIRNALIRARHGETLRDGWAKVRYHRFYRSTVKVSKIITPNAVASKPSENSIMTLNLGSPSSSWTPWFLRSPGAPQEVLQRPRPPPLWFRVPVDRRRAHIAPRKLLSFRSVATGLSDMDGRADHARIGVLDSCPDRHSHRRCPHRRCACCCTLLLLPPAGHHTHFVWPLRADVSLSQRTV